MSQKINIAKTIDSMPPRTGRVLKEDNTVVNIADLLEKQAYVSGVVVGTGTAEFVATAANTAKEVTIQPEGSVKSALRLEVENPSAETDLTVEIYDILGEKDYFVGWYTIPKKQTRANGVTVQSHARLLPPIGAGDIKVVVSNDQAITVPFDTTITIREV